MSRASTHRTPARLLRFTATLTLLCGLAGAACGELTDGPVTARACESGPAPITANVVAVARADGGTPHTTGVFDGDVRITGTAQHGDDLAIRQLTLAGLRADNQGDNFDLWSVTVPYGTLIALARPEDHVATLELRASDACDNSAELLPFELAVDPSPGHYVTSLSLVVEYPGEADYIPADGSVPAIVRVLANREAAGLVATLTASGGALEGATMVNAYGLEEQEVPLAAGGLGTASGAVLFSAWGDGLGSAGQLYAFAQVHAVAEDRVAVQSVTIGGAPLLVPAAVEVSAGLSTTLTVLAGGNTVTCQASPVRDVLAEATLLDEQGLATVVDLMGQPTTLAGGRGSIEVSVADTLAEEAAVVLSCWDTFGQAGVAEVRAVPLPAP